MTLINKMLIFCTFMLSKHPTSSRLNNYHLKRIYFTHTQKHQTVRTLKRKEIKHTYIIRQSLIFVKLFISTYVDMSHVSIYKLICLFSIYRRMRT